MASSFHCWHLMMFIGVRVLSGFVSTIFAIQDQVIATRVYEAKVMMKSVPSVMCRVCGQAEETILHLMAACPRLATSVYLHCHNLVASVIHWHLSKVFSLPHINHHPLPVVENSPAKVLWDFSLTSENHHLSNHPDIVVFLLCKKKTILFVEVSYPGDINMLSKEKEKLTKYRPLAHDFRIMYKMPVDIIPVVIGHSGVMSAQCQEYLEHLPEFSNNILSHLRKAALLGTIHTLHTLNF